LKDNYKPKIGIIGLKGLPALGGASSVGENLILNLQDKYDFTVYASKNFTELNEYKGIRQILFDSNSNRNLNIFLYYLKSLFHALFFEKYDLIHLHHVSSGYITPFLRLKYKVITSFHGIFRREYSDPKFSKIINTFIKFSQTINIYFSNICVVNSRADYCYLDTRYPNLQLKYIPNGVYIPFDFQDIKPEDYICFAANRIYSIKGLDIVLGAFHHLKFKPKLLVIGDLGHSVQYKKEILKMAERLNIEFVGLIKDKFVLYEKIKRSKFFIFPSLTEGMSMMLLEVAALKVPIIASNIPSNTNIFEGNEVLFFDSGDKYSLCQGIQKMLSDKNLRLSLSENAFKKVTENHKWEIVALSYSKLFNSLT
jgi:glycosyltransferase involved in cell wall biosynthesis